MRPMHTDLARTRTRVGTTPHFGRPAWWPYTSQGHIVTLECYRCSMLVVLRVKPDPRLRRGYCQERGHA